MYVESYVVWSFVAGPPERLASLLTSQPVAVGFAI